VRKFVLLETAGVEVTEAVLAEFPMVTKVSVEVRKPSALPDAEWAWARVERER
jgi:dihydroneopterin aldolase